MLNLLRLPEVIKKTGLSRSFIYDHVAKGSFPSPIKLGARVVAWRSEEIDGWIEQRTRKTRGSKPKLSKLLEEGK